MPLAESYALRETRLAERYDVNWFYLKSCAKCGGDLVLDEGDWLCVQCGTYFYTDLYRRPDRPESSPPFPLTPPEEKSGARPGRTLNGFSRAGQDLSFLNWPITVGPRARRCSGIASYVTQIQDPPPGRGCEVERGGE